MLNVLYIIDESTNHIDHLVFDPDNNELINPISGESWFFTNVHYNGPLLRNTSDFTFIKRTF